MFSNNIVERFKIYKSFEWKFININLFKETILAKAQFKIKKK